MRKVIYSSGTNTVDIKGLKFTIAVFSVVVVVLLAMSIIGIVVTNNKLSYYHQTQAKIINFDMKMIEVEYDDRRTLEKVYYPIVTYTANGKQYTNTLSNHSSSWKKGDTLDIAYNPNSPNDVIVLGVMQYLFSIITGALSIFFILFIVIFSVALKSAINKENEDYPFQ